LYRKTIINLFYAKASLAYNGKNFGEHIMKRLIFTLGLLFLTLSAYGSVKESWTCYRNGSEFLTMSFDGSTYTATLQGVLEKVSLKGKGNRPSELSGLEEPFYDSVNYTVKINRSLIPEEGIQREMIRTEVSLIRNGYWDCYGSFSDAESLECSVEIERD
jgi:hypothetical protein